VRIRALGTAAPPVIKVRTEDRSASAHRGDWISPAYMVDTPNIQVTRCRAIRSKAASTFQAGMITLQAPLRNVGSRHWFSAATWNSGALTSVTSSLATSTPIRRL
jgi:hypothetical protein